MLYKWKIVIKDNKKLLSLDTVVVVDQRWELEGLSRDRKLEDIQSDTLVFSWWVTLWEKFKAENDKTS